MNNGGSTDTSEMQPDQIRRIVDRDYRRIDEAGDALRALGLEEGADPTEITDKFQQYEQFYRVENFQRFEDGELTRKALVIRKTLSRAVVELQGAAREGRSSGDFEPKLVESVDAEHAAMAEIYFRDGITWLKLEDLEHAVECFERSMEHDPSRGVTLAYHAYARYRQDPGDETVEERCRESFRTAAIIEPQNADVHVLKTRFGVNVGEPEMVREGLERVRELNPEHPAVGELRRLYDEMVA